MTTKLDGVRDELAAYFGNPLGGDGTTAISAQSYEPGGGGYDPTTATRLETLYVRAKKLGASDWGRVRRIVDELPGTVVDVLKAAVRSADAVAARLPEAQRQGRLLAEAEARAAELEVVERVARMQQLSPMAVAQRVLEAEADLASGRRRVHVSAYAVERATEQGIFHGVIDVWDEAHRVIDQAVDAYLAARTAVGGMKRAHKARLRQESAALLDEMLGKKRAKERARFERKLRGGVAA